MRRRLVRFRQGAQPVEQAPGPLGVLRTKKVKQGRVVSRSSSPCTKGSTSISASVSGVLRTRSAGSWIMLRVSGRHGLARSFNSQSAATVLLTDRVDPVVATCDRRAPTAPRPVGVALIQDLADDLRPDACIGLRQRLPMPPIVRPGNPSSQ
jgi:hypothetical protein